MAKMYEHFKGGKYKFLLQARSAEDQTVVIVYQSLKTFDVWVRSAEEFFGFVEVEGVGTVRRFQPLDDE